MMQVFEDVGVEWRNEIFIDNMGVSLGWLMAAGLID
jgi:hypothetical protein